jgi:hypothetical protein
MRKKSKAKAIPREQPRQVWSWIRIGDRVRILDVSEDLKDPKYDSKNAKRREMRTAELFRFCVGRVFKVYGLDDYGNVELRVSNSSAVRARFGKWHSIWCEPEFVKRVRR